jgi:hypothetical protein
VVILVDAGTTTAVSLLLTEVIRGREKATGARVRVARRAVVRRIVVRVWYGLVCCFFCFVDSGVDEVAWGRRFRILVWKMLDYKMGSIRLLCIPIYL